MTSIGSLRVRVNIGADIARVMFEANLNRSFFGNFLWRSKLSDALNNRYEHLRSANLAWRVTFYVIYPAVRAQRLISSFAPYHLSVSIYRSVSLGSLGSIH